MATSSRIDRNANRDLAVIGVRLLDDAHMTWVAAEVESEHALRAWFRVAASHRAAAYLAYCAAVDREEAAARDLQRLHVLTQPYQERLRDSIPPVARTVDAPQPTERHDTQ
jgi:hypothetical protein